MKITCIVFGALSVGGAVARSFSEEIADHPEISSLSSYVNGNPDLRSALDGQQDVTILAPENRAFDAAVAPSGPDDNPPPRDETFERGILQYHIINGTHDFGDVGSTPWFLATKLSDPGFTNVTHGENVQLRRDGDELKCITGYNNESRFVGSTFEYDNGMIHIVDEVLTLPQSTTTTLPAANLTAMFGALKISENGGYEFNNTRDVTIFAPQDQGFERIGSAVESDHWGDPRNVSRILDYHMVTGNVIYSPRMKNETLSTKAGEDLHLSVIDGTGYVNSARIVSTDILVNNGIIHVISDVLNPDNSSATPDPDSEMGGVAFGGVGPGPIERLTGDQTPSGSMSVNDANAVGADQTQTQEPGSPTDTSEPTPSTTDGGGGGGDGGGDGGGGGGGGEGAAPMETAPAAFAALIGVGAVLVNV